MKNKLLKFIRSNTFKKITFVLGAFYLVIALFSFVEPEPFMRFGTLGLFVFNVLGGPGMFLIPLAVNHYPVFAVAFASALGMAINDSLSWWVGKNAAEYVTDKRETKIVKFIKHYGPLGLFMLSLMPAPYDFVGIIAGYLGFKYENFVIPTFLGRLIRFLVIGILTIVFVSNV